MIARPDPLQNAAENFQRPGLSYDQGNYAGFNPMYSGNQDAPQRAADWNWITLNFSPMQSSLQSGAAINSSGQTFQNIRVFGLALPDVPQGQILFPNALNQIVGSASLFWDNTSLILEQTGSATGNVAHWFRVTGDTHNRFQITADGVLGWGSGSATPDLFHQRDGANIMAQRNSTNAQTFRVYNMFTDASDGEWLELSFTSNVGVLRTTANGTGSIRPLTLRYGGSTVAAITINSSSNGGVVLGAQGASSSLSTGNVVIGASASFTQTSGNVIQQLVNPSHSDGGTNSTTVVNLLSLSPTVNYSAATKTGKVYLQYMSPTLTALPTGHNGGLVFSSAFTNASFPAVRFFNTSDEDTNSEWMEAGWHVAANIYMLRTALSGSGSSRELRLAYNNSTSAAIGINGTTTQAIEFANVSIASTIAGGRLGIARNVTVTATSGTHYEMLFGLSSGGPAPSSSSTMAYRGLGLTTTINYAGGGAGSAYLIYLNPTNTALPTGINAAIALSSTASGINGIVWNNQTDEQTNYEQARFFFTGNIMTLGMYNGGTGTLHGIQLGVTGNAVGIFGATPVTQPNGTGETVGFTAGVGTTVHDDSTFTGNVGATAYRISDIVKALKNVGIMAQ